MVVGVVQMLLNKTCLRYKGRVEPATPPLGQCLMADCGMLQRFDGFPSQVSAKFIHALGDLAYLWQNGTFDTCKVYSIFARALALFFLGACPNRWCIQCSHNG